LNELAAAQERPEKETRFAIFKGTIPEVDDRGDPPRSVAGNAPHILQAFEIGTPATMMGAKGAIKPV